MIRENMTGRLEIENLSVSFDTPQGKIEAVRDVSLSVHPGEVLAIVGESGCGKSVLCRAVMKLLPDNGRIESGCVRVDGTDITDYGRRDMDRLRGRLFSMIFQDPLTSLNPTIPVGEQIAEAVRIHSPGMKKAAVRLRVEELMGMVGISEPKKKYGLYPCHFSGGMRQRSAIAVALACEPGILFADEPTTSLDVTVQARILDLLRDIQKKLRMAIVFVSHDLGVVARVADRVAVMYAGKIVEIGTACDVFYDPRHPYTWGLLRSLPSLARRGRELYSIPGMPPMLIHPPAGDAFACRNEYALAIDYEEMPPMFQISDTHFASTWLLDERAPKITFPAAGETRRGIASDAGEEEGGAISAAGEAGMGIISAAGEAGRGIASAVREAKAVSVDEILLEVQGMSHIFNPDKNLTIKAVDDISFQLRKGEILGLVGESGSGKSTVARCVMNVYRPTAGTVRYKGINTCDRREFHENSRLLQASRQLIFQDSASSLNAKMTVEDIIEEPMRIHHRKPPRGSLREEAEFQLYYVGMDKTCLDKYPRELSGGMRQRVAIARALSMEPELLVADEPTASLDVSIQAQIVNLFRHLRAEHGVSILFIAHDLALVRYLCDRVGVMYRGKLVEEGPAEELFESPLHPYTRTLISAIPVPDPLRERGRVLQEFKPSPRWLEGEWREAAPEHYVLE